MSEALDAREDLLRSAAAQEEYRRRRFLKDQLEASRLELTRTLYAGNLANVHRVHPELAQTLEALHALDPSAARRWQESTCKER